MKKMLLPILIFFAGIVFSAFTISNHKSEKVDDGQLWYEFVGVDPNNPSDYVLLGDGTVAPPCNAGPNRCAVKAVEGIPGHPDLSDLNIIIKTME